MRTLLLNHFSGIGWGGALLAMADGESDFWGLHAAVGGINLLLGMSRLIAICTFSNG